VIFTYNGAGANSWLWDFGDGTISTDANPVHTYDSVGIDTVYTVLLTSVNTISGCSDTMSKQIVVIPPLPSGIIASENNDEMITIVPVPSSGILHVNYVINGKRDMNISIYNILGQKVYDKEIVVNKRYQQTIDLSEKPKGIYFVKFTDNEKQVVRKIILE